MSGHEWINLQWLYDALLYLLYRAAGTNALILCSVACYTAAFFILMLSLRRSLGTVASAVLLAWIAMICEERFEIRPEMVSFPLLQLLSFVLLDSATRWRRWLWLSIPIMALWVNTHALYVVGLLVLGCVLLARLGLELIPRLETWGASTRMSPMDRRRLLMVGGASALVTLVNPYHVRGALYPFGWHARTILSSGLDASSAFFNIGEFRPPFQTWFASTSIGFYQVFLIASAVVVVAACLLVTRPARPGGGGGAARPALDVAGLMLFVVLGAASVLAHRNMSLFALACGPFVGQCLAVVGSSFPIPGFLRHGVVRLGLRVTAALLLAGGIVIAMLLVASNRYYLGGQELREFGLGVLEERVPVRAVEFSRAMDLPGPLYNDLSAGGYLTWAPPVDGGVFIDGRLEVYGDFFPRYFEGLAHLPAWDAQAEHFGIKTVLIYYRFPNRHNLVRSLNSSPRWSLVYFDEVAVVFVRTEGNERTIARALEAFREGGWHARTMRRLEQEPASRWRFPLARLAAWDNLGTLYRILDSKDGAAFCYERALALNPPASRSIPYLVWLADFYLGQGDQARARGYLERAARARPDEARIRDMLQRLPDR